MSFTQSSSKLTKIISGAQTGADQAGLFAAESMGIVTGGCMTMGFRTLTGSRPDLSIRFGLTEYPSYYYNERTDANVFMSDGTVRFAADFLSSGEKCTLAAIKKYNKPYYDVSMLYPPNYNLFIKWLVDNNVKTLNVAGNSEQTAPGIFTFTFNFLTTAIKMLL